MCPRHSEMKEGRGWAEQLEHAALQPHALVACPGGQAGEEWFDASAVSVPATRKACFQHGQQD